MINSINLEKYPSQFLLLMRFITSQDQVVNFCLFFISGKLISIIFIQPERAGKTSEILNGSNLICKMSLSKWYCKITEINFPWKSMKYVSIGKCYSMVKTRPRTFKKISGLWHMPIKSKLASIQSFQGIQNYMKNQQRP